MTPEQKKRAILFAILAVGLVGVLIYQFMPRSTQAPAKAGQAAAQKGSGTAAGTSAAGKQAGGAAGGKVEFKMSDVDIAALSASVEVLDFDYEALRTPRDPMRPLVEPPKDQKGGPAPPPIAPPGPGGFQDEIYKNAIREKVVSGIVWDPENPCAVVDDKIVFVGSAFPLDITVVAIGPDYVTFRGGNVELPVRLKE